MKPSKHRKLYTCIGQVVDLGNNDCQGQAVTYHEIIHGGGQTNKKIAEYFNVQVPICPQCHNRVHGKDKRPMDGYKDHFIEILINWLGMDMYTTIRAFNNKELRPYLEMHKADNEARIAELEV